MTDNRCPSKEWQTGPQCAGFPAFNAAGERCAPLGIIECPTECPHGNRVSDICGDPPLCRRDGCAFLKWTAPSV